MSKRGRKRKDRRTANPTPATRPNPNPAHPVRRGAKTTGWVTAPLLLYPHVLCPHEHPVSSAVL